MKTFSILSLLVAVIASALLTVNFETAASVAFSLGFASILVADYSRRLRFVEGRKRRVPIVVARGAASSPLGLAA
jgi:hypothetical protein